MEFFDQIQAYFNGLEQKRFYQYVGGFLGVIALITFLLLFQYFRSINFYKSEAEAINELREDTEKILARAQKIKAIQKENEAVLAQDKNFKIVGYFEDLISRIGLAQKKTQLDVTVAAREGKYQEKVLTVKFAAASMKELTQLLQEIENNKRVFIKELTIEESNKQPNSIDVTLVIATLEPKPQETGEIAE